MNQEFSSKVVMLTGATGGIGKAIAKKMAKAECLLIICGRNQDKLELLKKELAPLTQKEIIPCVFDICDINSAKKAIELIRPISEKINILINCAGAASPLLPFQDLQDSDIERIIQLNLSGLLKLTQHLTPTLIKNAYGHIINIGSAGGKWAHPRNLPYIAAKAGLLAATEALRIDLRGTGTRVSIIEPGLVQTEMARLTRSRGPDVSSQVYGHARLLKPEEIANTVLWCLTRPPRVNVQEVVIFPTDSAGIGHLHRRKKPLQND